METPSHAVWKEFLNIPDWDSCATNTFKAKQYPYLPLLAPFLGPYGTKRDLEDDDPSEDDELDVELSTTVGGLG